MVGTQAATKKGMDDMIIDSVSREAYEALLAARKALCGYAIACAEAGIQTRQDELVRLGNVVRLCEKNFKAVIERKTI